MFDSLEKGGGVISDRVESVDLIHLRKCLEAGLLERGASGGFVPTQKGIEAMEKELSDKMSRDPSYKRPAWMGNEFLEGKAIGSGVVSSLAGRAKAAAGDMATDAGVAAVTGGMSLVPGLGGVAKAAVGAVSDLKRAWRESRAVKQAMELASQMASQKAQTRDPSLIQRTVDNYVEISDACLNYLNEKERSQIVSNLFQAIKDGSVGSGHAQRLANEILTNKANQMMQAVSSSRSKVAV
jgi:hypothetical protein